MLQEIVEGLSYGLMDIVVIVSVWCVLDKIYEYIKSPRT